MMNTEEVNEFKEIINIILEYRKVKRLSINQKNRLKELLTKKLPQINVDDEEELVEKALFIIGDHYYELEKENLIHRDKIFSMTDKLKEKIKIEKNYDQSSREGKLRRRLIAIAIERCRQRIREAREKNKYDPNYALSEKKIVNSLLKLIEDKDPAVRFAAIDACNEIDDPAIIDALKKAIDSKDMFVRIAAEGVLLKKRKGL